MPRRRSSLTMLVRLASGILLAAGALLAPPPASAVVLTRPIMGDLDGNGRITVGDATQALKIAVGLVTPSAADLAVGDLTPAPGIGPRAGMPIGKGAIDINDAIVLLRHSVGLPGGPWADPKNPISFALIRKQIFLPSCAASSCHNSNARRAGLDLENPLEAYALLVGHDPSNRAAADQGMKRVAAGHPEQSYLMAKLQGTATGDLGVPMPYGTSGLPAAQIDLVKHWIDSGAPFDVDDGTLPEPAVTGTVDPKAVDVTLPAPPPDQGFQLSVGPFDAPLGQEVQRDYFLKTPNTEDHWINRVEYAMNKGSHHLLVFKSDIEDVPDHVTTDFGLNIDFSYRLLLGGQNEALTSDFPPGVGILVHAHQQLDVQMHYVNTTTQSTPTGRGKLVLNFWYAKPGEVTAKAGLLFGQKFGFVLPPHQETTLSRSFLFPTDVKVYQLAGHFHSRGRQFRVYRWDGKQRGDLVYQSQEWDDPAFLTYAPPIEVKAGTGLTFEATYKNDFDHSIVEGPHAETQEHLFYFGWFYRDNDLSTPDYYDLGL